MPAVSSGSARARLGRVPSGRPRGAARDDDVPRVRRSADAARGASARSLVCPRDIRRVARRWAETQPSALEAFVNRSRDAQGEPCPFRSRDDRRGVPDRVIFDDARRSRDAPRRRRALPPAPGRARRVGSCSRPHRGHATRPGRDARATRRCSDHDLGDRCSRWFLPESGASAASSRSTSSSTSSTSSLLPVPRSGPAPATAHSV